MRLLDLIKEDDGVRLPAYGLGELSALVVSDVSGRRSDQTGDRVLLHVLRHVDTHHVVLVIEEVFCQCLRKLCLADAGRSHEEEGADGLGRILDACLRTDDGVGDLLYGLILSDDSHMQLIRQCQDLCALRLGKLGDRDAGPLGDDLCDLIVRDGLVHEVMPLGLYALFLLGQFLLQLRKPSVQDLSGFLIGALSLQDLRLVFKLLDLLTERGKPVGAALFVLPLCLLGVELLFELCEVLLQLLETLFGDRVLFLLKSCCFDLQLGDPALLLVELCRQLVHLSLDHRAGLIHEVDGLIRKETVRNVTVGKHRGLHQGGIGDLDAVVDLITVLDTSQNGNGILDARLIHHDGLETALEGRILFNLAVLIEGRCTDTVQLASCQHGL